MKIQAQSSLLLRQALQKSAKCIDGKAAMAILSNVLLTQQDGKFYFISATSDSQLTVPAPFEIIEGDWKKDAVLPINALLSLLSTLPSDCVLTFDLSEVEKVNSLKIEYCTTIKGTTKKGSVDMGYEDATDFPRATGLKDMITHIALPMPYFKTVLSNAGKFVANDELRPVMNCLCIDVAEDLSGINFVASSGHILVRLTHTNDPKTGGSEFFREGKASKILVHSSYFKTLSAFDDCEEIHIQDDANMVLFSADGMEFICKKVDGKYPNYNSVIPRNNPYHIVVDKKELLAVVKRVALFSSESSNLVSLKKDGMFLNIHAEDIDFSTYAEDQVLINDSQCKDGFRIGFKASCLIDTVNAIPSDSIKLELSDPSRAGIITADNPAPMALALLMPMLLNE